METNTPFDGGVLRTSVSVVIATIEQCLKILCLHGAVVEEALSVAGAHVAQHVRLLICLDAFDHDGQMERMAISSIDEMICVLRP